MNGLQELINIGTGASVCNNNYVQSIQITDPENQLFAQYKAKIANVGFM